MKYKETYLFFLQNVKSLRNGNDRMTKGVSFQLVSNIVIFNILDRNISIRIDSKDSGKFRPAFTFIDLAVHGFTTVLLLPHPQTNTPLHQRVL